ncbi:(2Fe-2S)-binding protein [Rhodopila sp.]|uniref:(2Fe-2S)-binding protein n=1 Tax=Rhodopila sp. TaxID=2480087 RepID=UPI003D0AEAF4
MLTRPPGGDLTIWFEGAAVTARAGDSVAVALLAAGIVATRTTALSASPRGPFCLMGDCFECLAIVDGQANVQTCMMPVRNGMRVLRQDGARKIDGSPKECA